MEPESNIPVDMTESILVSLGYKQVQEIGRGSFGQIYSVVTPSGLRAVKTESKQNIKPMLVVEYEIMDLMRHTQGFPEVYLLKELDDLNYIEMQLLKKGLDKLLKEAGNKFTLKTTLIIMIQILERLKQLHHKGYIYRDIKPSNFIVGEEPSLIYILDFGLVKKITKARPTSPTKNKKVGNNRLVGTPIFCSIAAHLGENQTPHDDIESLMYMGIYLLRPLPWENLVEEDKAVKQDKIRQIKMATKDEELCKDLPKQFLQVLRRARGHQDEEMPQHEEIKALLTADALKGIDPRKNPLPEWAQFPLEKPKPEVKINFQIKPKQKKKKLDVVEVSNTANLFQNLLDKSSR